MDKLTVSLTPKRLQAQIQGNNLSGKLNEQLNVVPLTKHNELENLDYESSGHTGFASEERLNALADEVVPKRLSALPIMQNTSDRGQAFLYVDNNGQSERISMRQALSTLVRTDTEKPDDMQVGEYLFLKRK